MNEAPAIMPAPVGERPSPALPGHKGSEQMTTDVAADGSAPIQQSPTERARAIDVLASVTARMAPAGEYAARDIRAGNFGPDTERAIAAMIEFASQAAQPAEADGWVMVPREPIEAMLHYLQCSADPRMTWASLLAATPKVPATDAGQADLTDEQWARAVAAAPKSDGPLTPIATPPAPNDDLRAALEPFAAVARERLRADDADTMRPAWNTAADYRAAVAALKENHRG